MAYHTKTDKATLFRYADMLTWHFLLKDSLDLIIKSSKNNFVIKNNFGTFLVIFLEVVKHEAEKSVKIGQIVVKLQTAVALVLYNLQ